MFDTEPGEVFGDGESGGLVEDAREVCRADAAGAGRLREGAAPGKPVGAQVPSGAVGDGGQRAVLLHELRHREVGEVAGGGGDDARESPGGVVVEDGTCRKQAAVPLRNNAEASTGEQMARAAEGQTIRRPVAEARENEEACGLASDLERNRDFVQSGIARANRRLVAASAQKGCPHPLAHAASGFGGLHRHAKRRTVVLVRDGRAELVEQLKLHAGEGAEVVKERPHLREPEEALEQGAVDQARHAGASGGMRGK